MSTNQTYIQDKICCREILNNSIDKYSSSEFPFQDRDELLNLLTLIRNNIPEECDIDDLIIASTILRTKLSEYELRMVKNYCNLCKFSDNHGFGNINSIIKDTVKCNEDNTINDTIHFLEKQVLDMYFIKYGYGRILRINGNYYHSYELY